MEPEEREGIEMNEAYNILYVCRKNESRSLAAEYLTKWHISSDEEFKTLEGRVTAESAGLREPRSYHMRDKMKEALLKMGCPVDDQTRPRKIDDRIIIGKGPVLCFEERHEDIIENLYPQSSGKSHVINEYTGLSERVIHPDDMIGGFRFDRGVMHLPYP